MSITAMKQALAKVRAAQQCHPNAVMTLLCEADEVLDQAIAEAEKQEPIYAHPDPDALNAAYIMGVQDGKKMREWVGLTEDEIKEIFYTNGKNAQFWWEYTDPDCVAISRAIEAKLKEKNA